MAVGPSAFGIYVFWNLFKATDGFAFFLNANYDESATIIPPEKLIEYRNGRFGTCLIAIALALIGKVVNLTVLITDDSGDFKDDEN
jgi:hypothetical protein